MLIAHQVNKSKRCLQSKLSVYMLVILVLLCWFFFTDLVTGKSLTSLWRSPPVTSSTLTSTVGCCRAHTAVTDNNSETPPGHKATACLYPLIFFHLLASILPVSTIEKDQVHVDNCGSGKFFWRSNVMNCLWLSADKASSRSFCIDFKARSARLLWSVMSSLFIDLSHVLQVSGLVQSSNSCI